MNNLKLVVAMLVTALTYSGFAQALSSTDQTTVASAVNLAASQLTPALNPTGPTTVSYTTASGAEAIATYTPAATGDAGKGTIVISIGGQPTITVSLGAGSTATVSGGGQSYSMNLKETF